MLQVLHGGNPKQKPDYSELYRVALVRTLDAWELKPGDKDLRSKLIYYGVKYCNHSRYDKKNYGDVFWRLELIQDINAMIGRLSPAELMQMFPVRKTYNGERYQSKDYFYTMNELRRHGMDKPISDKVFDILWDYCNYDITDFMVDYLSALSDMRRLNGGKGMMEEFLEERGITPHYMNTDSKGRMFLTDGKTGKTRRGRDT